MKQNTILIFIVSTVILLILLGCFNTHVFEKFNNYESVKPLDCFKTETVYLDDVSGGLSTGSAYIDKQSDTVSIDISTALPLVIGGVFNYIKGSYKAYISKTANPVFNEESESDPDLLLLGDLEMKEQREYSLTKTFPINIIDDLKHLLIVRFSSDLNGNVYKPVIVLKGVIRI